jgi:hypothetical protein
VSGKSRELIVLEGTLVRIYLAGDHSIVGPFIHQSCCFIVNGTRPQAMKLPGSWRELAPRAYRKPMGKLLEACRKPLGKLLGNLLGACKMHLGNLLGAGRKHLGKHLGNLLGAYRIHLGKHLENLLRACKMHLGNLLGACRKHLGNCPLKNRG